MFNDVPNKNQLLNFVRQGRAKKPVVPVGGEPTPREQELMGKVVAADPFSAFDKEKVKQMLKEEDEKEVYSYEKDNIGGLGEEDFEKLVQERMLRIQFEKEKQKCTQLLQKIKDHQGYLESLRGDIE
jgi:organic radical activating enzyme